MNSSSNTPETAIALYLGESFATLQVFDSAKHKGKSEFFEKSVYLPQTSLKSLLLQTKAACGDLSPKKIYIVTRYLDRLKNFRLGGSVVQVVAEGFQNSYSLANTSLQSLAAPALILPVSAETTETNLIAELARLKKINSEINKVVFQIPENLFSAEQSELIRTFFIKENFKIFTMQNPYDLESVRRTLLNAGSEGTKEEILADIKETLGDDVEIQFWVNGQFSKSFESIDLYFSSHCFLRNYLKKKNRTQAFYFDLENWDFVTTELNSLWHSPWGTINYSHPQIEEYCLSPYCELTVDSNGQLITAKNSPQFEPGPIIAGRSVKTLILDAFSDELKNNKLVNGVFPLLATDAIQQKVNTQFQILHKAQNLDQIRLTREDVKHWLSFTIMTWILQKAQSTETEIIGDMAAFFHHPLPDKRLFPLTNFLWTEQIQLAVEKV